MGRGTYQTAEVECPFPRWTIYAGIFLERTEHVLVTTRSVPFGQRLAKSDLQVVPIASGSVTGDPISARDVIGKKAAVPLAAGQIITRDQIVTPLAIRNGDKVVIHWRGAGVVVTAAGTALESGGSRQSILVENDESHRPVMATVVMRDSPANVGQLFIVAPRRGAQ
jgi:flagella basal body P-ring formation protein FlgA